MEQDAAPATLRDTYADAFDDVMAQEPDAPGVAPAAIPAPKVDAAPAAADAPPKAGDQPRRDDGTFDKKPKGAPPATPAAAQAKPSAPASQPAAAAAPQAELRMPLSWKKELEPHWATIPHEARAAIIKRDADYASGISTYKGEWDRAKPLLDALAPFMPDLERHRIAPDQFISNLATAHRTLALGSPEQKLAMFTQLAEQYQIPLAQMFERGQDGQVYLRNVQAAQQQAPAVTPQAIEQIVQQKLVEQSTAAEVKQFQEAKDDAGGPRYPHFETVKDTMAGLLHAGFADDLASAYQASIRMPKHAELFEAEQRQQREAADKAAAGERAKQTQRARRNAISTPGSTPTALVTAGKGDKGLRDEYEEAFASHAAGRV